MLSFTEQGHGPALVLVHAYPLDSTMWREQLDDFSKSHRVVAPDVLGFGGSQPPTPWTMERMGDELARLLDQLNIRSCTLAGLSMGGYIAIPFTLAHPDRVERLVLAHTRARADTAAESVGRNEMIAALKSEGIGPLPGKMLPRLLAPNASPGVRSFVEASIRRASAEAAIHAVTAMRDRADQTGNLGRIACPTLVVAGDGDAIMKVEDSEKMAAAIPNGEIAVIPNVGHLSNLEDPAAFNQNLDRFLHT